MNLRDFKISDLHKNEGFLNLPEVHKKILAKSFYGTERIAYTLEHNGEIIGSAGIIQYWPGVYEGWALLSELINKYPIATTKSVKEVIKKLEQVHKIRRLQTLCLDVEVHKRWLKYLGFKCEGTLKNYGINGETYLIYARV